MQKKIKYEPLGLSSLSSTGVNDLDHVLCNNVQVVFLFVHVIITYE